MDGLISRERIERYDTLVVGNYVVDLSAVKRSVNPHGHHAGVVDIVLCWRATEKYAGDKAGLAHGYFGRATAVAKVAFVPGFVSGRGADDTAIREMWNEIQTHAELCAGAVVRHPNVQALMSTAVGEYFIAIVTPLAPFGDLLDHVSFSCGCVRRSPRRAYTKSGHILLDDAQLCHVAHTLAYALSFVHACDVAHRDVKPENVLLFAERMDHDAGECDARLGSLGALKCEGGVQLRLVLADFGFARPSSKQQRFTRSVGSPGYAAPEVYSAEYRPLSAADWRAADVWSLGATLYMLAVGRFVHQEGDEFTEADKNEILRRKLSAHPIEYPDAHFSGGARAVISSLLCHDASQRPTSTTLFSKHCTWAPHKPLFSRPCVRAAVEK